MNYDYDYEKHYCDVILARWRLKSPAPLLFTQPFSQAQAPVPLSIFRSNSKFDQNWKDSSLKYTWPITKIFCTRHDSVTVVTCAKYLCMRNFVVIGREHFKPKHCKIWSNFEFDRNIVSGKNPSSPSLAFVRGIHWGPVNSPYKWPVTQKMFLFDDVIINYSGGSEVTQREWVRSGGIKTYQNTTKHEVFIFTRMEVFWKCNSICGMK